MNTLQQWYICDVGQFN